MTRESNVGEQIIAFLKRNGGKSPWTLLYRYVQPSLPNPDEVETIIRGLITAGYVNIDPKARMVYLLKDGGA